MINYFVTEVMDWFQYDKDLRHEIAYHKIQIFHNSAQQKSPSVRLKFTHLVIDW